jgi:hypothetical protein
LPLWGSGFSLAVFGLVAESIRLLPVVHRRRSPGRHLDATAARAPFGTNGFALFLSFATLGLPVGSGLVALPTGLLPRWLAIADIVLTIAQSATLAIGPTGAAVPPFVLSGIWLAAVIAITGRRRARDHGRGVPPRRRGGEERPAGLVFGRKEPS